MKIRFWITALFLAAFAGLTVAVNAAGFSKSRPQTGASYAVAYVERVDASAVQRDSDGVPGLFAGTQTLTVRLLTGRYAGNTAQVQNLLTTEMQVVARRGMFLVVSLQPGADGAYTLLVDDYFRLPAWAVTLLVFLLLMAVAGGARSIRFAVSMAFGLLFVLLLFVPLVFRGWNPLAAALLALLGVAGATFGLTDGWGPKGIAAGLGTMAGALVSCGVAAACGAAAHLNGFSLSDADSLIVIAQKTHLQVGPLLFAGVLISSFGAVMDIAMSISTAVYGVHLADLSAPRRALLRAGLAAGRDMMGTMVNTLLLAFAGSSTALLLLQYSYLAPVAAPAAGHVPDVLSQTSSLPLWQLLNGSAVGVELMEAAAGSISVILTVPIMALCCALLFPLWKRTLVQDACSNST